MKELLDILDLIISDHTYHNAIETNDYDKLREISDEYFLKFKSFYSRVDRHRYSDISKHLTEKTPDALDLLRDGMNQVLEDARSNEYDHDTEEPQNLECYKKVVKLADHIELEASRLSSVYQIKVIADRAESTYQKSDDLLKKSEQSIEDTKDKAQKLSQQLISILGIFAGIVVTFSFATSTIGEALSNLTQANVCYLGFIICLLGVIFANVVAMLMSFVTKLSWSKMRSAIPWVLYSVINVVLITLTMIFYFKM